MSSPAGPTRPTPRGSQGSQESPHLSRWEEIRLVAARELRTQAVNRATIISTLVMLVLVVGGILAYAHLSGGETQPYRVAVAGPQELTGLDQVVDSAGQPVSIVNLQGAEPTTALDSDAPQDVRVDMVVDTTGTSPRLLVAEEADEAVSAALTSLLQQQALASQVTSLGGDPSSLGQVLEQASPEVVALDPPQSDAEDFFTRYTVLLAMDVLLFLVIMGGGQVIAMSVVEEKSSRIVEILLACVRPSSLLAGKVLGTGTWLLLSSALLGGAAVLTANATGIMPEADLDLDTTFLAMLGWMLVGYATVSVLFGAAASLVSRQEDAGTVTAPLAMLLAVPYGVSILMAIGDPQMVVYRVLSYLPVLSPFLMPARLVLGVSSTVEQSVALALSLVALPLLVALSGRVYTRAVTRTGARVPLREVLSRRS
ncbi:ABC transporter permease [Actinomyces sp. 2119]|uniref:ABC transporter permease n=1 Tax=Actinomyces lilanjuaniae TaxID=2321394 RepID=A0ABN5PMP9_9ACTO|nr:MULTISPECIES: ABC transporter permease [Actinomyces]AYD89531.1 ABC transporter permease [Actinomyces lilanjuaniae]RJF43111.1 ABC transporter permease [Actinomyces sp. 2119]